MLTCNPKVVCKACGGGRRARSKCQACRHFGFELTSVKDLWAPSPAFLVCGGPSLKRYPMDVLRERGVLSLGINNASAYAPCSAATFGDPQTKFHTGIFLDGKCLVFCPDAKLRRTIRVKRGDHFRTTTRRVMDCPGVVGIASTGRFDAATFLTDPKCHWGHGGKDPGPQPFRRLCSMLLGLRILHHLGCPRVYMLGVDFSFAEDKYAWTENASGSEKVFWKMEAMLDELRPVFERANYRVFNCNAESKCRTFPHVSWDDAVRDCRGSIPREPWDLDKWYSKRTLNEDRQRYPEPVELP